MIKKKLSLFLPNNYSSILSPVVFVIDFDNTLAVYDKHQILDRCKDTFPSLYIRPFLFEFLDYIKSINKNNIIILWSNGKSIYVYNMLLLLNIAQYFNHILTRDNCNESQKLTGSNKSFQYLIYKFPLYKKLRVILIDDLAKQNTKKENLYNSYDMIITVKPFTINDVIAIVKKNKQTMKKDNKYGDTTLLNLIIFLHNNLFYGYNDNNKIIKYKFYLDKNNTLNLHYNNDNNDDDKIFPIIIYRKS